MIKRDAKMIIVIPEGFESKLKEKQGAEIDFYSIIKSLGMRESIQRAAIKSLLTVINNQISDAYIKELATNSDPAAIKNPGVQKMTKENYSNWLKEDLSRGNEELNGVGKTDPKLTTT